jgi:hypothetical protein
MALSSHLPQLHRFLPSALAGWRTLFWCNWCSISKPSGWKPVASSRFRWATIARCSCCCWRACSRAAFDSAT